MFVRVAFLSVMSAAMSFPVSVVRGQESAPTSDYPDFLPSPTPDVLTPNRRSNTPDVKIGIRAGINTSSYSNDRYLDNTLLDVGETEGELAVYTSAAGFGFSAGLEIEYPTSPGLSWVLSASFVQSNFGSGGPVREPCERSDGSIAEGDSYHEFKASIDFLRITPQIRLAFPGWYFVAGIAASHPLSTSLKRTRRMGRNDCFFPGTNRQGTIVDEGEIPAMQGLHYALRFGAGLVYRINDRAVFAPELTLDFGSSQINKSPDSDLGIYTASATLRYDIR